MPKQDFALAEEPDGRVVQHRADCPHVRRLADIGLPVMTMFGCEGGPLPDVPQHDCLTKQ